MSVSAEKKKLLSREIQHINIKELDLSTYVDQMRHMAFTSRDVATAADYFVQMLDNRDNGVFLGLAGSLISAGLKQVVIDMINCNMVDAIVATGANIVDQDFFEALGFRHYVGDKHADDHMLRELDIDRIYDTYIDEEELKVCDGTVSEIADAMAPGAYSSREFIREMGRWIHENGKDTNSIIGAAYAKGVPIFCPAFSDSSAGLGLVHHQWHAGEQSVRIDSVRDFLELTKVKMDLNETGIFLIGGGVPKNFIQDTVISAEVLGYDVPMHKYAIQITVADERDGALSGSTLREACSWGKVDTKYEQMVYSEASFAMPIIVNYAYHRANWKDRIERRFSEKLDAWHETRAGQSAAQV
ncbi:MAG: deoxyhypusine synthase [Phycisphaerales bacterium]|nr:deoxyhypusine synthase [Phycisphaerales bacterium]